MFVPETASKQLGYFQKAYLLESCNTESSVSAVHFETKLKQNSLVSVLFQFSGGSRNLQWGRRIQDFSLVGAHGERGSASL